MNYADIAVIGGGASGLSAALAAAKQLKKENSSKKVVVFERNERVGKKILSTGNGRCNLSNEHVRDDAYYGDRTEIADILSACSPAQVEDLFADMGLLCQSDDQGRIYPANFQAAAVLKALRTACEENGVDCHCDCEIFSVSRQAQKFLLKAASGAEFVAEKLILACGGKAAPKQGSAQNGFVLAEQLGHHTTRLQPALVQLRCLEQSVKSLKGLRCKVSATLSVDGKQRAQENGEVIFADGAISGICIFDLSVCLADLLATGQVQKPLQAHTELILDLAPSVTADALCTHFRRIQANVPHMRIRDMLSGVVNIRVGEAIVKQTVKDPFQPVSSLSDRQLNIIAKTVKAFTFHITGFAGWDQAQITLGGVPLTECSSKTMESTKCAGLYLCGEMLNAAGKCGGYNLHFAWATGIIAGQSAAENIIYI